MTYLEVVNKVLKRMRERTVTTVNQTAYSSMVGEFVNDAKKEIEGAWKWGANRSIKDITTADGTKTYAITGFGEDGEILSIWNDTSDHAVHKRGQAWFDRHNYTAPALEGDPFNFCFRGKDNNDDSEIELYPTPDGVYALKLNCYIPQAELEADTDTVNIPWRPLVLLARAMLVEEKGEDAGQSSGKLYKIADDSLADAISIDANRYPDELIWNEV